ncbi:MAG: FGGY-family carbohydrate kinase [Rhodocyclaceae bacterium]
MQISGRYVLGLDLGTSGCRAVAIGTGGNVLAQAGTGLPAPLSPEPGWAEQDPEIWWEAIRRVLTQIASALPGCRLLGMAVDGTSGTVLLADGMGHPLGAALMYHDRRAIQAAAAIAALAPADSPARGPSSSLAKLLHLSAALADRHPSTARVLALHQADWISGRLCGSFGHSDWNNCLKLGYDAERRQCPDWLAPLVPGWVTLPTVHAPGRPIGFLDAALAAEFGFSGETRICAGTTDSTAAVIAALADQGELRPGLAVTSLGSTLVLKIVAERPITSTEHGVYSQRLGDFWLVGGASNCGGAVLRPFFSVKEIVALSARLDTRQPTGLDYYPLPSIGERFPRADPHLAPRLEPRPAERQRFLQGLLEGMAAIEAEGYRLLAALGAPQPSRIVSIGGGAANPAWTDLRTQALGIPVTAAAQQEAAYGAARLALSGCLGRV